MTTHKEALKLALGALEYVCRHYCLNIPEPVDSAITAIKEALAQPEQEPVELRHDSWIERWAGSPPFEGYSICCGDERIAHLGTEISGDEVRKIVNAHNLCKLATKQEQEPVDYLIKAYKLAKELSDHLSVGPAKPQRKPLTDELVLAGARALAKRHADSCGLDFDDVWKFYADEHKDDARAVIEAANGIKGDA